MSIVDDGGLFSTQASELPAVRRHLAGENGRTDHPAGRGHRIATARSQRTGGGGNDCTSHRDLNINHSLHSIKEIAGDPIERNARLGHPW